jgi:hypothetical protein
MSRFLHARHIKKIFELDFFPNEDATRLRIGFVYNTMIGCGFECKTWDDFFSFDTLLKEQGLRWETEFQMHMKWKEEDVGDVWLVLDSKTATFIHIRHIINEHGWRIEEKVTATV